MSNATDSIKYSFGDPDNPLSNDPRFDTEDEAIKAAEEWLVQHPWDSMRAVWQEWGDGAGAETVCLVWEGTVWRPS